MVKKLKEVLADGYGQGGFCTPVKSTEKLNRKPLGVFGLALTRKRLYL